MLHHERNINQPGGVRVSNIERSSDQIIRPVNSDALTSWVGFYDNETLDDMDSIAPMLSKGSLHLIYQGKILDSSRLFDPPPFLRSSCKKNTIKNAKKFLLWKSPDLKVNNMKTSLSWVMTPGIPILRTESLTARWWTTPMRFIRTRSPGSGKLRSCWPRWTNGMIQSID